MTETAHVETIATPTLQAPCCKACGHVFLPPGPVCPRCWSDDLGQRDLSGLGEVASFTIYRHQYHPDFPPPYVIALIALREGPRMISNITGCAPEQVRVGMPVRVRFERRGDRNLPLFTPVDAPGLFPKTSRQGDAQP